MIRAIFNPFDSARATVTLAPTNHAAAAIYNSSSQYIVRVWFVTGTGLTSFNSRYSQTRLTTQNQGTIAPMLPGEPAPPFQIDTDDLATLGAVDLQFGLNGAGNFVTPSPIPFALLRPGWSFVGIQGGTGGAPTFSWIVDWVYPRHMIFPEIGDLDIDPKKY